MGALLQCGTTLMGRWDNGTMGQWDVFFIYDLR